MIEIRPIHPHEAEPFLRLLCEVFDLDFGRARSVFFTEPLFDLQRKWALVEDGHLVSVLTTVPLLFGWGGAIGIAGVATRPSSQGRGYATQLLDYVLEEACGRGEKGALLFARDARVYRRSGFEEIDEVLRGPIDGSPEKHSAILSSAEVRRLYDYWAQGHSARLRRDDKRWDYWKWTLRVCSAIPDGYLCLEGGLLRECVAARPPGDWPVGRGVEWLGLRNVATQLGLPLLQPRLDLYLMGRGIPEPPQMFMTDQF